MTGRTVSHYEILDRLGAGGMGEVFRARDTLLNRMVAVKVLPKSDSAGETSRLRFLQEARAASGLSHPNIITVHDILSDDGADLMVMELVAGKTLAELSLAGGLPIPQALKLAVQISSALAAAHAAGVVHRDIKPGNIMVTPSGLVKVLDFGLAKPTFAGLGGDSAKTASIAAPLTVQGSVVGTVNYMSPEQAEGKQVDGRSDIFSFGILLYEMVTGQRAFPGESAIAAMTAILRDEVRPIHELIPAAPPQLEEIVGKCLRKNRDERWQTMDELQAALENLKLLYDSGNAPTAQYPVPPKTVNRKLAVSAAACGVLVLAGAIWWEAASRGKPAPAPPVPPAAAVETPRQTPAPAPDGALSNDSIIEMLQAKVSTAVIVGHIRSSKTQFDLSTGALIQLSQAGAPEALIQAMRDASRPARPAAGAAAAQPEAPPAPPSGAHPEGNEKLIAISDAVPVSIELAEDIPLNAHAGMPLKFTVLTDIVASGDVVIPKGALVTGQIAGETRKKALVLKTEMTFQLEQVEAAGGQRLKLRAASTPGAGSARRPVDSGTAPGAKKKPKDVAAIAGTQFVAYIDGNQSIAIRR